MVGNDYEEKGANKYGLMNKIRNANIEDLQNVVSIHEMAFPEFFLTTLGSKFLKLFYTSVMNHKDGVLLVCENEERVIGFCAGTMLSSGFNSKLIKSDLWAYMMVSLKILFTRPKSLIHLMKNISKEESSQGDDGQYAELLSIGVDPTVQRSGGGTALLKALEEEVKARGGEKLSLTTDFNENEKAIGFYKSLGYEPWYDFITYPDRRMYRMIKVL